MSVTMYTDCSVEECARRLAAAGGAGGAGSLRWALQATRKDSRTGARTFRLAVTSGCTPPGHKYTFLHHFHGRLEPYGPGTQLTGYYGASRGAKLWTVALYALPMLALAALDHLVDAKGNGTMPWPWVFVTVAAFAAFIFSVYALVDRSLRSRLAECEASVGDALADVVGALPLDQWPEMEMNARDAAPTGSGASGTPPKKAG